MQLKKYDVKGKEVGEVVIEEALLSSANSQMIKDYIVAIRNNARQWSASTKGRSEINRTKKKPHPQKGQGRARQGNFSAPQYRGGGIVFGPKPKEGMHTRINRKEKRAAIASIFSDKVKEGKVFVLEAKAFKEPKTKVIADFLNTLSFSGKRTLFLGSFSDGDNAHEIFVKSMRNIPRSEFMQMRNINGYDLALSENVIVMADALDDFFKVLGK